MYKRQARYTAIISLNFTENLIVTTFYIFLQKWLLLKILETKKIYLHCKKIRTINSVPEACFRMTSLHRGIGQDCFSQY